MYVYMWLNISALKTLKYSALLFTIITLLLIYLSKRSQKKAAKLLGNKFFIGGLVGIIIWSYVTLNLPGKALESMKIKKATKAAIIAFLITILSELKLTIAPFWLVWINCLLSTY